MVPQTFEQWKHCIIYDCKIDLTAEFTQQRLAMYEDRNHPETSTFIRLYGEQHLNTIITWLQWV